MKAFIIKFISVVLFCTLLSTLYLSTKATALTLNWIMSSTMPYIMGSNTAIFYNNRVFNIGGGYDLSSNPPEIYSSVVTNGVVSPSWQSSSAPLPHGLIWHSTVQKDNYVYVIGGNLNVPIVALSDLDEVLLGKINAQGNIESWTVINHLPQKLSQGAAAVIGDRIYFAGGFTGYPNGGTSDQVYFADINEADGTLSDWHTAGTLPDALNGLGMVAHNGHLIIIGGKNNSDTFKSDVYTVFLNADGTIQNITSSTSFPTPIYRAEVIEVNSTVYVMGGFKGIGPTDPLDTVYSATPQADGTITSWNQSSNSLPQPICCAGVASDGNYVYIVGGLNAITGQFLNTVYSTSLNSKTISFEDVLRDIHNAYLNKQIDNGIDVALSAYIKSSQRSYERGDKAASLLDLNNFIRQLNKFNDTKIDPAAFSLLSSDASGLQTLINSL